MDFFCMQNVTEISLMWRTFKISYAYKYVMVIAVRITFILALTHSDTSVSELSEPTEL